RRYCWGWPSEVALLLPVLHGCFAEPVVTAGRAALGDPGGSDLVDDLADRGGCGLHTAGQRQVADSAEPHGALGDLLAGLERVELRLAQQHAVALEDAALVGVVDRGDLDALLADVVPDVELGPVRQREDPHVLALVEA